MRARGPALAAAAAVLSALPALDKAWHIDEPFFLAIAGRILAAPLDPLGFLFNWYGWTAPMALFNNTPPLWGYLLAGAASFAGGQEWTLRLCLLPLDVLAALSLYGLASRFLARPLLPVLLCLAAPAYLVDMQLLLAEKPMAAFGFAGLWALAAGLEKGDERLVRGSAALLALAVLSKYAGVLFLAPAAALLAAHGRPGRHVAAYAAAALSGVALYVLWNTGSAVGAAWRVTSDAARWPWEPFKLRSVLAFVGGATPLLWFWPAWGSSRAAWAAAALAAALFLPGLDVEPVRAADRLLGAFLAAAAAGGAASLLPRARPVWAAWTGAVLFFLLVVYWSVLARLTLFLVPPLVFAAAERLEGRRGEAVLASALLASCLLSAGLGWVDYRYAGLQRDTALRVKEEFLDRGRTVWYSGHWGLQHYLDAAGARQLDRGRGGWEQARPGEVVLLPRVNANVAWPPEVPASAERWTFGHPLPLRLISGWDAQAGFYSNTSGFLPYSLSREPLDEYVVFTAR